MASGIIIALSLKCRSWFTQLHQPPHQLHKINVKPGWLPMTTSPQVNVVCWNPLTLWIQVHVGTEMMLLFTTITRALQLLKMLSNLCLLCDLQWL